ncbi:equilibrative nucleoside transporter 1-like [Clytia hemisphaerica]|uniref:Equilibrative nucleoside transporter 3 n=1 Tax=Clytia hemisphaerica TaxID=252671 RepID=A0A7M5UV75_9CNID|eukprot:TCONS_00005257-protein
MDTNAKRGLLKPMDSYDSEEDSISSDDELLGGEERVPSIQTRSGAPPASSFTDPDDMSASLNAPEDKGNVIYIIFFIQGIGMLLPWNFFITAKSYFSYKFEENATFQDRFENAFALAAMIPGVLSLLFNIFMTGRISRNFRLTLSLTVMFLAFVATTVLVKVDTQDKPTMFFAITVATCTILNLATGIFQGTIFGIAGIIGSRYMQAIMSGQATAGIFAAVADLATKLANPNYAKEPTTSALIYFIIASAFIIITGIAYSTLFRLPRMQFYFRRFERHTERDIENRQTANHTPNVEKIPYVLILKAISGKAASVFIVFAITLTCFPAIMAGISSTNKGNGSVWDNELFATLVVFLVFNVGDWIGRILAGIVQIVNEKSKWLIVLCISRIVFIPLFLMCNYEHRVLPYVFNHDFWPIIINILFSVSNGYLGSLGMMYGPKMVALEYGETAGTMMSLFLQMGLTFGACLSFAF